VGQVKQESGIEGQVDRQHVLASHEGETSLLLWQVPSNKQGQTHMH
jgi:hypothetical protein